MPLHRHSSDRDDDGAGIAPEAVSAPSACASLERYLGADGHIAAALPGFEQREGQEQMMREVMSALDLGHPLVIEAGTGTGKSLAYLLPVVLSGRRAIISTATRTLQDQLLGTQIPFLRETLGLPFEATVLKGRTNYLCLLLLEQARALPALALDHREELLRIADWAGTTETGDRAEHPELADRSTVWRAVAADADQCLSRRCPHLDACFLMKARRKAAAADLVIVNHHLLLADLSLGREQGLSLLPEAEVLIVDEAHRVEDIAAHAFGAQVSDARHLRLAADLRRALSASDRWGHEAERVHDGLVSDVQRLWRALRELARLGRVRYRAERLSPEAREAYERVDNRLVEVGLLCRRLGTEDEALSRLAERAEALRAITFELVLGGDDAGVRWLEEGPRATFLRGATLSVSEALQATLFERFSRVILASATLTAAGRFDHALAGLGLGADARSLAVPSPFRYAEQGLLYLPADLPDPSDESHLRCAVALIEAVTDITRGKALLLFTSYQKMREAHAQLAHRWRWPTFMQGEAGRDVLLARLRDTEDAVLFATQSFWEGVDIPGQALSLLIIDKLPFESPGEPLAEARIERLRQAGQSPFSRYQLPRAAIALKQGLGRLIRHRADRGIAVILDPRLLRAGYGRTLLASLPPFRRTSDLEEVRDFWVSAGAKK